MHWLAIVAAPKTFSRNSTESVKTASFPLRIEVIYKDKKKILESYRIHHRIAQPISQSFG